MKKLKLIESAANANNVSNIIMFALLIRHGNGYMYAHTQQSSCRDSLCGSLVKEHKNKMLYDRRGKVAIMINLKNVEAVARVINFAEKQLGVKQKTKFRETQKNGLYIALISPYWTKKTYLLSLWALICRIAGSALNPGTVWFKYADSPKEFLENYVGDYWYINTPYVSSDRSAKTKYEYFVKNGTYITPGKGVGNSTFGIVSLTLPI